MKARQYINMMGMAAALLLSSCVKDELFNTPHPGQCVVVVTADWNARSTQCPIPDSYMLCHACCDGGIVQVPSSGASTYPVFFGEGSHTLLAWANTGKFSVEGHTATVDKMDGMHLEPLPDYLLTGAVVVDAVKDDTVRTGVAMRQRVRDLRLELEVTQGRPELIQSVTATLSGIAGAFDMERGQATGDAVSTVFSFTREGSKLTADARLLGTMGAVQTLVLDIVFTDDGRTQHTEVNLTEALADFNGDMTTAYRVTGTLETPVGMEEGNAEITGWETVEGGEANAEM